MSLYLSEFGLRRIYSMASLLGAKSVGEMDACIIIEFNYISLRFFQTETYSKIIGCHVIFNKKTVFFIEDLIDVIESYGSFGKKSGKPDKRPDNVINDEYIVKVCDFLEKNKDVVFSLPPSWYMEVSEKMKFATAVHFPDIAEKGYIERMRVLAQFSKDVGE